MVKPRFDIEFEDHTNEDFIKSQSEKMATMMWSWFQSKLINEPWSLMDPYDVWRVTKLTFKVIIDGMHESLIKHDMMPEFEPEEEEDDECEYEDDLEYN
jgi:hypothetical protein